MATIEEIEHIAEIAMDGAKQFLAENGCYEPMAFFYAPPQLQIMQIPGQLFNDVDTKEACYKQIGKMAREQKAEAVIIITDSWYFRSSPEMTERMLTDPDLRAEFESLDSCQQLADAGFGTTVEALGATVQTPLLAIMLTQIYSRTPDGIVFGECIRSDTTIGLWAGRAFQFFEPGVQV